MAISLVMTIKHLLDIETLEKHDIEMLLEKGLKIDADLQAGQHDEARLKGRIILNMFFENSTRTRISFEMAALRLGASVINWDNSSSSTQKGESLTDTLRCVNAYSPDCIIVRHSEFKAPYTVKRLVETSVVNAGDSYRAHPSQALLDALTLLKEKGKIEGLTIAICGDVTHSRVASDNFHLLHKMGANVRVIAPEFLMPKKLPYDNFQTFTSMEKGLDGCDAVMMLRNQKERMEKSDIPDDAEYFRTFGLTPERLQIAKPDAIVMHPGPMNRGVEIADAVADDPYRSVIFKQMANGLPMRMAILDSVME